MGDRVPRFRFKPFDPRIEVELPERGHNAHDAVGQHERGDDGALLIFGQEVKREVDDGEKRKVRNEAVAVTDNRQGAGPPADREFAGSFTAQAAAGFWLAEYWPAECKFGAERGKHLAWAAEGLHSRRA